MPICKLKWEIDLGLQTTFNWKKFIKTSSTQLKKTGLMWFAFRIIHQIICTKLYLNKLKFLTKNIGLFVYINHNLLPNCFFIVHLLQEFGHVCPFGFYKRNGKEINFIKIPLLMVKCLMIEKLHFLLFKLRNVFFHTQGKRNQSYYRYCDLSTNI